MTVSSSILMADVELIAAVAAVVGELVKLKRNNSRKTKKIWVRQWIQRRNKLGASQRLLRELAIEDPSSFFNFLRMNENIFNRLLEKVPQSDDDWTKIINGFHNLWNFPNCIGAIDGKHIVIQCPPNSGSLYHNYKGTFSIVLLALVDHNYNFTFIDVGTYGNCSDGGIFAKSSLHKAIEEKNLNLPNGSVILGDEAFPLKSYLMKPYPRRNQLNMTQKVYNYRHCRARRISENGFGILAARFRVFRSTITLAPSTVTKLVKAACALHNWLRKESNDVIITPDVEDRQTGRIIPGSWRNGDRPNRLQPTLQRNYPQEARQKRDNLAAYFVGPGAVDWQYRMIQ
ncbi:hypothetical protein ABEB36_003833 [Hypothenemus hampei]|uniref:DDE Tnp4 domain-containing protein n=1 Tax=Hypothenemus hampei TaxID=57062 RepID=A0ABD1F194_HYPHA